MRYRGRQLQGVSHMERDRQRSSLRAFLPDEEGLCVMLDPITARDAEELKGQLKRVGFNVMVHPHLRMAAEEAKQVLEAMEPHLSLIFTGLPIMATLKYLADITVKPFSEAFFGELGRRKAGRLGQLTEATAASTRAAADEKPALVEVWQIYAGPARDVVVHC